MVHEYEDVDVYWQNPQGTKPGVCKTHDITNQYRFLLNQLLATNALKFDREMFTVSRGKTTKAIKSMFREQLERYHEEFKAPSDNFGKGKTVLTGKMGSKQDDLAIAGMQCIYWGRAHINNARRAPGQLYR